MTNPSIMKYLMIFSILIFFSILIYFIVSFFKSKCSTGFVFDKEQNKCRIECKPNETYDKDSNSCLDCPKGQERVVGTCVPICEANKKRCKDKGCYNPISESCDDYGNTCPQINFCNVANPNDPTKKINKCCHGDLSYCNKTKTPNECTDCPYIKCNLNCCKEDEINCIGEKCCTAESSGKTSKGEDICCDRQLCNGICCDPTEECDPNTNTCKVKCGNVFCDDNSPICFENTDTNVKSCINANKCWGQVSYTPPSLQYIYQGKLIDYQYSNNPEQVENPVTLCTQLDSPPNNSNTAIKPEYLYPAIDGLTLSSNIKSSLPGTNTCTKQSCIDRISQYGTKNIDYGKISASITGKECNSKISCSDVLLNNNDANNICSDIELNEPGRCCRDINTQAITGQICPSNTYCVIDKNDNTKYTCLPPSEICENGGSYNPKKFRCDCPVNVAGLRCEYTRDGLCESIGTPQDDGSCVVDCEYAITPEECCPFPGGSCDDADSGTPSHNSHWNCPLGDDINPNKYKYHETVSTTVPAGKCKWCFGAVFGACIANQGECMRPKVLNNKTTKISGNQCKWAPDNI